MRHALFLNLFLFALCAPAAHGDEISGEIMKIEGHGILFRRMRLTDNGRSGNLKIEALAVPENVRVLRGRHIPTTGQLVAGPDLPDGLRNEQIKKYMENEGARTVWSAKATRKPVASVWPVPIVLPHCN
jgi:hypothetical protein